MSKDISHIEQWLNNPNSDYNEGVELFERNTTYNTALVKRMLRFPKLMRGALSARLKGLLKKLAPQINDAPKQEPEIITPNKAASLQNVDTAARKLLENPPFSDDITNNYWMQWSRINNDRRRLSNKLGDFGLTVQDRCSIIDEIESLIESENNLFAAMAYYYQHRKVKPKEKKPEIHEITDLKTLQRLLNNNEALRSKNTKALNESFHPHQQEKYQQKINKAQANIDIIRERIKQLKNERESYQTNKGI